MGPLYSHSTARNTLSSQTRPGMLEAKLGIEGRNIRIPGTPPPTPGWKLKSFRMQKGVPNLTQFLDFLGGHPFHSKDDSNSGHMRVNTTLSHRPELFRTELQPAASGEGEYIMPGRRGGSLEGPCGLRGERPRSYLR